ncbi:ABC transporter permease [uncultured Albimonas sp.]|uniref:ABC transporter permease n=1 Tax=uncultured Albimonas sp. TaxID=1331701 RepID=UPI0030EF2926
MEGTGDRIAATAEPGIAGVSALLPGADLAQAVGDAGRLLLTLDPLLAEIVLRSLAVALSGAGAACLIGLPLGAMLALSSAPGRGAAAGALSALAALPPACVGVAAGLALAAAPAGGAALLGSPLALALAQFLLALPVVAALAYAAVSAERATHAATLRAMRVGRLFALATLLREARPALLAAALAGLARALGETGAALAVGGAIPRQTQLMSTAAAAGPALPDPSRGLALALALAAALAVLALALHAAATLLRPPAEAPAHA